MKMILTIMIIFVFSSCYYGTDEREILPSFNLLMMDSTTVFNTDSIREGKPFVILYFSPDCEHCHEQVKLLLENMPSFKSIQFYFFTPFSFKLLKQFYKYYHLYNYPNITVGYDYKFFIPAHYKPNSVPWVFIFNGSKRLERIYQGGLTASQLMDAVSKN